MNEQDNNKARNAQGMLVFLVKGFQGKIHVNCVIVIVYFLL